MVAPPPHFDSRLRALLHHADLRTAAPRVEVQLRRLARGDGPIAVGPWLSEVGFEVLYWLPFVAWFAERYEVAPERLVAVTRGGAGCWYRDLCSDAVDVFERHDPSAFKAWNRERMARGASQKQLAATRMERELVGDLLASRGLPSGLPLLHPSLMYRLFAPAWDGWQPLRRIGDRIRNRPLPIPPGGPPVAVGDGYVAVKFYFSDCFPASPHNLALTRLLLEAITEHHDVVLLSTGIDLDDHADLEPHAVPRLHNLEGHMTPATNLEVQTRAIAGARALIGTYGGFSYLGPFLGVPSFSLFSEDNFVPAHLDVMRRTVADLRRSRAGAGFAAEHIDDLRAVAALMGGTSVRGAR